MPKRIDPILLILSILGNSAISLGSLNVQEDHVNIRILQTVISAIPVLSLGTRM